MTASAPQHLKIMQLTIPWSHKGIGGFCNIARHFGTCHFRQGLQCPMARVSQFYDVVNRICIRCYRKPQNALVSVNRQHNISPTSYPKISPFWTAGTLHTGSLILSLPWNPNSAQESRAEISLSGFSCGSFLKKTHFSPGAPRTKTGYKSQRREETRLANKLRTCTFQNKDCYCFTIPQVKTHGHSTHISASRSFQKND